MMSKDKLVGGSRFSKFTELIETQGKIAEFIIEHGRDFTLIGDIIKNIENYSAIEAHGILHEGFSRLYKDGNIQCQLFVLQFVPSLISVYVSLIGCRTISRVGTLETILLSIYNKEAAASSEMPFSKSYRIPSLSNSSIFHEPVSTTSSALTERALSRHEQSDTPILLKVPSKILNRITVSSRSEVLDTVLTAYNCNISGMAEASHIAFCKMVTRAARSGFSHLDSDDTRLRGLLDKSELDLLKHYARIKLANYVFQEMITGLYFIMHDGLADAALLALENLENMAKYTINAALTMTLNAVTATIKRSYRETEVPLALNPKKSKRRTTDSAKRRYAFSAGPALLTPNIAKENSSNPGKINGDENSIANVSSADQDSLFVEETDSPGRPKTVEENTISVDDVERLSLPDQEKASKQLSESESEDANECTNLLKLNLNDKTTEDKTATNHERIAVSIITGDVESFNISTNSRIDGGHDYQLIENRLESEGKFDTIL